MIRRRSLGFTLIELLIVVAIIAILAAIAVPNFLEAQTRAKVSRVKADLRTLALAIEAYTVDNNMGPTDTGNGSGGGVFRPGRIPHPSANATIGYEVTTPIAYLTNIEAFRDVFKTQRERIADATTFSGRDYYNFINWNLRNKRQPDRAANPIGLATDGSWILIGAGPDGWVSQRPGDNALNLEFSGGFPARVTYDPTNGTVSYGDIHRTQRFGDGVQENANPPQPR